MNSDSLGWDGMVDREIIYWEKKHWEDTEFVGKVPFDLNMVNLRHLFDIQVEVSDWSKGSRSEKWGLKLGVLWYEW